MAEQFYTEDDVKKLLSENQVLTETEVDKDETLTKYQLNPAEIIEKLEHDMKGEIMIVDYEKQVVKWESRGKKLMNDDGVKMVITIVGSHIDRNTLLSTLEKNEIVFAMRSLHKHLVLHFGSKYKDYEIDKNDLTPIIDIITNKIWFALKRAEDGAEKNFLAKAGEKRIEKRIIGAPNMMDSGRRRSLLPFFR